jgi:hypothetical protein
MLTYENAFDLLNKTILLFNRRRIPGEAPCKCHHINLTCNINQSLQAHTDSNEPDQWIGTIVSEQIGSRRMGGSLERVKELMAEYLSATAFETIESLVANKGVWFNDLNDRLKIDDLARRCHE